MLAIRMQRTGRKGHAQFRVIVQDKRFSPTSGRVVAFLGSYDPHSKKAIIDTEKADKYLANGAKPTDRVAVLLKSEGVKLPKWVVVSKPQKRSIKNPDKLRRNRPPEAEVPTEPVSEPETEVTVEAPTAEEPATSAPTAEENTTPEPEEPKEAEVESAEASEPASETVAEETTEPSEKVE
jgi:small subunit ribosomal protein S16